MKKRQPVKVLNIYILLVFIGILFLNLSNNLCNAQTVNNAAGYTSLVQQADQALASKDYPTALLFYEKAKLARPELKYAAEKINEINGTLDADPDSRSQLFENLIIKAESFYNQKDYPKAKTEYQKALVIDPSAQFPKDRLGQISALYTDPSDQAYFNDAVSNGDKALSDSDFEKAILYYETALTVKPGNKTIKDKITVTKKQQAEFKLKGEQSEKIIAAADKLLQSGKRPEARAEYQKALDLTPGNEHAKLKLQEIDKYTSDKKAEQDKYDRSIELADQFYISRDFINARLKYQEALKAKPEARYPKEMLEKTKSGESQLQSDQEKYDAALAGAESLLKSNDYEAALIGYRSALAIKPAEVYPKTKISEIEKLITEQTSRKEAYDIAIKNGDQALGEKKYDPALAHYRNALTLLPGEQYPALKIEEINALDAQQKSTDENFRKALDEADLKFKQQKYEDAIVSYTKSLGFKPGEAYPQQKITEARELLAAISRMEENYSEAIANGDRLLGEKKYTEALDAYKQALSMKPAEKYPKDKTDEINKILAKQKSDDDRYNLAINKGDQDLASGNLNSALVSFQDALTIKPNEQYPQEKISFLKVEIASQQKTKEQYTTAINNGDKLFAGKEFEQALAVYTEAAELKKDEKYPKEQIEKINKQLADLRNADENYTLAVTEGDNNFTNLKYNEAITSYKRASTIKPSEVYPKTQVEKINGIIAEQKKLDAGYVALITSADKLFTAKKYDESISEYRKALVLKPSEQYPSDKITESEKLIADLKILQGSYEKAIAEADKYLSDKDYITALTSYKNANLIKPAEVYPKQKIIEIQAILDKDKAEGQRYQEALTQADKLFTDKKYREALDPYQRASGIRPAEKYPQDQIALINQLLSEQKKLDDDYQRAITDAGIQLKEGKYNEARILYINAGTLKPTEQLPGQKIAEIDAILAELQNKEQSYSKYITEGDTHFTGNSLNEAIVSYTNALKIKPAESYPKAQIEKINVQLAEQKKLDAGFTATITSADKLLAAKKYEDAVAEYRKALLLKPSEKYPADKIAEAEKLISDLKALQESYDKAISEGDKYFSEKDFSNSILSFKNAAELKPAEAYPKQKIAEVQAILDKDKAEGQRYQEAVTQADKDFANKKYSEAVAAYQRASGIKPAEKYPLDQISLINQMIAEQKKLDDDYLKAISEGNNQLASGKYNEARVLYTVAANLKPAEKLPKDKIVEIDGILAQIQAKEQSYTKSISDADAFFADKKYQEAITSYNAAASIKPEVTYPKIQVGKINALLEEQKKLDDSYVAVLTSADKLFESKEYTEAIAGYRNALRLKPSEKYPSEKIAEAEKQITDQKALQVAYDKAVAEGNLKVTEKDYVNALAAFKNANSLKPTETYPLQKISEVQAVLDKIAAENSSYQEAIVLADKFFAEQKYRDALEPYQRAATIKPAEKYANEQITRINQLLAEQQKLDEDYQKLITDANAQFKALKYNEARITYVNASTMKPTEQLPKEKIAEIDVIIAEIKLKDENYNKAISYAAELYAGKDLSGAMKSYEEALIIKPSEKYPQERISAIRAEIKAIDDSYSKAVALGDNKLASKNLMDALNAYQNALEIKPGEVYPKSKIAEINSALVAQKEEQEKMYATYLADGDKLFGLKDYTAAKSAYTKATGIKPDETYPKQRINEITRITEEIELARRAEYNKALGEADKLYNTKIFDQAIDAYETASKVNPGDPYPEQQIAKIRKYMVDHAIQDLYSQSFVISEGNEKKFTFTAIEQRLRKNNYILLKARSTGKSAPKVYLNYGKDNQKNGGIVLRSLDKATISDYLIRISVQDKWYREDNNWISLFVETGDIEITKVQIAAGDE